MEVTDDEKKRMTDSERQDLTADIEKEIVEERKRGLEWILTAPSRQVVLKGPIKGPSRKGCVTSSPYGTGFELRLRILSRFSDYVLGEQLNGTTTFGTFF